MMRSGLLVPCVSFCLALLKMAFGVGRAQRSRCHADASSCCGVEWRRGCSICGRVYKLHMRKVQCSKCWCPLLSPPPPALAASLRQRHVHSKRGPGGALPPGLVPSVPSGRPWLAACSASRRVLCWRSSAVVSRWPGNPCASCRGHSSGACLRASVRIRRPSLSATVE